MLTTLDKDIAETRLIALTEEMSLTLQRASRSLYVKETADFACAIADATGRFIAYPQGIGVSAFLGLDVTFAVNTVRKKEGLKPGDVILTNDPYLSQGLSTHLPDVHAIAPYFHDGEIVAYGWAFIHVSDVGGRVPSSISVTNQSIYAEGLRIPPVKYVSEGKVVPAVEAFLAANSRVPDVNEGDFQAMLAALARGGAMVEELTKEYGAGGIAEVGAFAREQTAVRAGEIIRTLREGTYCFEDYLDNDGQSSVPLRIMVNATVKNGRIHLDFTGTDYQVDAALNVATGGRAHSFIVTRIFALIGTLDRDAPLNGGLMDVIDFTAPRGTLLNPVEPAAVGVRHATSARVNDVIAGALIQALPEQLPAASSGMTVPVVFAEQSGARSSVQVVEPMVGGTGARYGADGVDGRDASMSNMSNNPVEQVESGIGIRVLRYSVRPDSGGAGKWRGGCGLELEFEALVEGSLLARGLERLRFRSWGFDGGGAGKPAQLIINEGTAQEKFLRVVDVEPLKPGDRVTLRTPGAGGFGNPCERPVEYVLRDIKSGFLTHERAYEAYGVVIVDNEVDVEKTAQRREFLVSHIAELGLTWSRGPEYAAWNRVAPSETLNALVEGLEPLPVLVRSLRRRDIIQSALAVLPEGFPGSQATEDAEDRARGILEQEVASLFRS